MDSRPLSRSSRNPARVLVVDDHPVLRHGVAQLIDMEPDLTICGEAGDAAEALAMIEREHPDITIVDLTLEGGMSGLDLIQAARREDPGFRAVVLSMHDEAVYAERLIRAGARGYLMKQEATEKIVAAVREVLRGRVFASAHVTARMLDQLSAGRGASDSHGVDALSDREMEVFQLLAEGYAPRHIAERLFISARTVEAHRSNIREKLGIGSSSELTRFAIRWKRELAGDD